MQPTSIGSNIDEKQLYSYVQDLTGKELEEYDIVWPSETLFRGLKNQSLLFFSGKIFNDTEFNVHDAMVKYVNTCGEEGKDLLHHFKSVYVGEDKIGLGQDGSTMVDYRWFLLTSACLSLGAIGAVTDAPGTTTKEYKNFEMGIMFVSSPSMQYNNYMHSTKSTKLPVPFVVGEKFIGNDCVYSEWPYINSPQPIDWGGANFHQVSVSD